jgi:hypothetical protein
MKIDCAHDKLIDLEQIVPNPKNYNRHPAKQIEMLSKIIAFQGQRSPIVVSKRSGFIVKGHGRLEAIKKLGWDQAAVDYQDYENEAQEYADMISDNKIAELADADDALMIEILKTEVNLDDLPDLDVLGMPGFNLENFDAWDSDIDGLDKVKENLDGINAVIKITCKQELKDEVLIYLKDKLMETSFEGVHIE